MRLNYSLGRLTSRLLSAIHRHIAALYHISQSILSWSDLKHLAIVFTFCQVATTDISMMHIYLVTNHYPVLSLVIHCSLSSSSFLSFFIIVRIVFDWLPFASTHSDNFNRTSKDVPINNI